ncbi:hypothetical protein [Rubripirellula obstinata]|uniref:hypothetical protein n=1 Tax=Rubripirellula obstinata TaxID=406547 RepID=UPI00135ABED3|nr:hypothetical protein [Rubripirellula obstinata]
MSKTYLLSAIVDRTLETMVESHFYVNSKAFLNPPNLQHFLGVKAKHARGHFHDYGIKATQRFQAIDQITI